MGSVGDQVRSNHRKPRYASSAFVNVVGRARVLIIPWSLVRVQVGPPIPIRFIALRHMHWGTIVPWSIEKVPWSLPVPDTPDSARSQPPAPICELARNRHIWPALGTAPRGCAWVMGQPRACRCGILLTQCSPHIKCRIDWPQTL